jgi:hypothetical protein
LLLAACAGKPGSGVGAAQKRALSGASPSVCSSDVGPTGSVSAGPGAGSGANWTISIDGAAGGRAFDGIGAVSGGGGNSRLLIDYAEPFRSQILDYLFKPNYGAALQMLKVEIGGDMNSTDGAEPSHMHAKDDLSCTRGYEWWLMAQAKARNPNITLHALAWGAPGWVGNGNFWSQDMIDYLMKWLGCAKANGLTIDTIGGWNERGYDTVWFGKLHNAIAANGFATKVVGADQSDWGVANDLTNDANFRASVDIVGVHYPCGGDGAPATSCPGNDAAIALGLPLWASENGSQDFNSGAPAMIRAISRGYIDAKMTAYINWPLVAAMASNLPWPTMGLLVCGQPWSGAYDLGLQLWISAHLTQFSQPGWSFIDNASGYLAGDRANGSYITLKSANADDYSVVLETTEAFAPQTVAFTVAGGLSGRDVHIWTTDLGGGQNSAFIHGADVTPDANGAYWVTLEPHRVYTISTIKGQCKGDAHGPPPAPLALPYAETFERSPVGALAPLLGDQDGAFEIAPCGGGRAGQCYREMTTIAPIGWATPFNAYALIGTTDWNDYVVSADVLFEQPGSAELIARYSARNYYDIGKYNGYYLSVTSDGAWSIVRNQAEGELAVLTQGSVAPLGTGTWHSFALSVSGTTLTAFIDGTQVGSADDAAYRNGPAGLSVGAVAKTWLHAQFDNLSVTSSVAQKR